tara:strand:- start:29 stop:271 length:243 start_codon:yes stop_codon:yes gene_type:complete
VDPPVVHSPPLLYHVEHDPMELWKLNTTDPEYEAVIDTIDAAVKEHERTLIKGLPAQLDGQNPVVEPCCDRKNGCMCGPW